MKKLSVLFIGAALSAVVMAAPEAKFKPLAPEHYPTTITNLKAAGMSVSSQFPTNEGLRGWVIRNNGDGKHTVVFTPESKGDALLAGMLLNAAGENLTLAYAERYLPAADKPSARKPAGPAAATPETAPSAQDYSAAYQVLSDSKQAPSVTVGHSAAKAHAVVLIDPLCGYCKLLVKLLAPSVAAGELRVTYVPVAILSMDSAYKAAGMLAATDANKALADVMAGTGASVTDMALVAKVSANTAKFKQYGFAGTPVVIYQSKDKTVNASNGLPSMARFFDQLGISGKMDELRKQPELARYLN